MSEEESCVVRIVNLDEIFTKEVLKKFILMKCQPSGDIKNIYLKRENETQIFYGYVVFEHSYDAKKVTEILNGYIYMTTKFKVELIGPNLVYHIYPKIEKRSDEYYICCSECRGKHDSMKCPFVKLSLNREKAFHSRKVWAGVKARSHSTTTGIAKKIPHMRDKVDGLSSAWRDGSSYANIYITNISPSMTESDLKELVESFGPKLKVYLGRDKITKVCKGFAYVNFKFRSDATEAIESLHGYVYDDRPLKVEWSKK